MIVPEGYEKLAVIGIAYKGQYAPNATYKLLNAVYYEGSTFVALKDNPVNPPVADGVNWQYLAKGFLDGMLSAIDAKDTSGLIGTAGETVDAQALLDDIADRVATKLLLKNQIVNNLLATIPGNALDAMQGKALSDRLDQVNSDYTTTEKQVGTWIDGSPIYQAVIDDFGGMPSNTKKSYPYAGIDQVICLRGIAWTANKSAQIVIPSVKFDVRYSAGSIEVISAETNSYAAGSIFIIEYIKTSA